MSSIKFTTTSGTEITLTNIATKAAIDVAQAVTSLLNTIEEAILNDQQEVLSEGIGASLISGGTLCAVWGNKEVVINNLDDEENDLEGLTPEELILEARKSAEEARDLAEELEGIALATETILQNQQADQAQADFEQLSQEEADEIAGEAAQGVSEPVQEVNELPAARPFPFLGILASLNGLRYCEDCDGYHK